MVFSILVNRPASFRAQPSALKNLLGSFRVGRARKNESRISSMAKFGAIVTQEYARFKPLRNSGERGLDSGAMAGEQGLHTGFRLS